jgi:hypothetical protein
MYLKKKLSILATVKIAIQNLLTLPLKDSTPAFYFRGWRFKILAHGPLANRGMALPGCSPTLTLTRNLKTQILHL